MWRMVFSDILADILSGIYFEHFDSLSITFYLASTLTYFLAYIMTFFLAFFFDFLCGIGLGPGSAH